MSEIPILCDQRGLRCCGTPACLNAGLWTEDPYDEPVYIRSRIPRLSHMHAEPICAFPDCETYLTRGDMATMRARQKPTEPSRLNQQEQG